MKPLKLFLVLLAAWVFLPSASMAASADCSDSDWSLFQLTLFPGAALVSPTTPVIGVNLEPFWGNQKKVTLLNLQLLYGASEEITGVSVLGFGTARHFAGLQFGGATFSTHFQGVNFSLISGAWESRGLQVGLLNFSGNTAPGAPHTTEKAPGAGMQLGVFNSATNGFQIGLLNYNENSPIPWMILFNVSTR